MALERKDAQQEPDTATVDETPDQRQQGAADQMGGALMQRKMARRLAAKKNAAPLAPAAAATAIAWYRAHADRYPPDVVSRIHHAVEAGDGDGAATAGIDDPFVEAVAGFQKEHGLTVDGEAGAKTLTAMFGADIRPAPAKSEPAAPKSEPASPKTEPGTPKAEPSSSQTTDPNKAGQETKKSDAPPQPHTDGGGGAPAPVADGEWATNAPNDADYKGDQELGTTSCKKGEVYDAISAVAPGLTHDVKVSLVGHASVEQHDKCLNNNFAGVEGNGSNAWVMAWTSAQISAAAYQKNPELYKDWFPGKPNAGVWEHKPAGTIQVQLDRGEKLIIVRVQKRRPAYKTLDSAAVAFIHIIEKKFQKMQASGKQDYADTVAAALAGDADAYAKIVTLRDTKLGILPYNPDAGYPKLVIKGIGEARTELASRAPKTT